MRKPLDRATRARLLRRQARDQFLASYREAALDTIQTELRLCRPNAKTLQAMLDALAGVRATLEPHERMSVRRAEAWLREGAG